MNKTWVWVVIIIIIILIVGGYLGRHKIKSMLGMNPAPIVQSHTAMHHHIGQHMMTASSSGVVMVKSSTNGQKYLTDAKGMTLYTYAKDKSGVSTCTGACLVAWPAYTVSSPAPTTLPANISIITRSDGTKQYAWKGMPLYYFASDKNAGDMTGNNVGSVWHIVSL